jgi:GNAT superfamily N-acetyltransferase
MKSLAAPTKFVRNQKSGRWTESGVSHYSDRLPDRFAVFPGNNNYRGAKIAHFSQLKKMRDMGVRHVISLSANAYGPQRGPNCGGNKNPCEPDWAKKLGMTWMQVPLGRRPPSDGDWQRIRRKLAQGNVYFHCNHGVDRTGAIGARFRKETERGLSDRDVLDRYTYIFGGQWKGAKDRNKFLRAWVQRGRFDPALKSELDKSMTGSAVSLAGMDPKVVAGVSSLVLALGLGAFFLGRRRKEAGSKNQKNIDAFMREYHQWTLPHMADDRYRVWMFRPTEQDAEFSELAKIQTQDWSKMNRGQWFAANTVIFPGTAAEDDEDPLVRQADLHLEFIVAAWDKRNLGIGTTIMNKIMEMADKHQVSVSLQPDSKGRKTMDPSTQELDSWYRRIGFNVQHPEFQGLLIRNPRKEGSMNGTSPGGMRFVELMERGAKARPMNDARDIFLKLGAMMEDFSDEDVIGLALVVKSPKAWSDPESLPSGTMDAMTAADTTWEAMQIPGDGMGKVIVDGDDETDGWVLAMANTTFLMAPGESSLKVHLVDQIEN